MGRSRPLSEPIGAMPRRHSVLIIGSEAVPFAKTGGLADVLGALPAALARLGWAVTLVLPRYRGVTAGRLVERFPLSVGGYTREVGFYEAPLGDGARAMLVDARNCSSARGCTASATTITRITRGGSAMLVRAALEFAGAPGAAGRRRARARLAGGARARLSPKTLYAAHPVLGATPSVFTIHNLAYQGLFATGLAAASRPAVGAAVDRAARVLGTHQPPQGRHQRRRR